VEFLPYITLVILPVVGAFLGVDLVLRLSVLLCLHSVIISLLPKPWVSE
jgi:hypothetical protein